MKPKEYIRKYKIKQKQMAKDLDITPGYLSGIINGTRTPSLDLACQIEKYFNYEVSRLELLYPNEDWNILKNPIPLPSPSSAPATIISSDTKKKVLDIIRGSKD